MDFRSLVSVVVYSARAANYLHHHSRTTALADIIRVNHNCMHILVDTGYIGRAWEDLSGTRTINQHRGIFFGALGYQFYHPDPTFTPNNIVDALVRSSWNNGGLNPEFNHVPVVSADRFGYVGYFWRQTAGDRGGGSVNPGFCQLCQAEHQVFGDQHKLTSAS